MTRSIASSTQGPSRLAHTLGREINEGAVASWAPRNHLAWSKSGLLAQPFVRAKNDSPVIGALFNPLELVHIADLGILTGADEVGLTLDVWGENFDVRATATNLSTLVATSVTVGRVIDDWGWAAATIALPAGVYRVTYDARRTPSPGPGHILTIAIRESIKSAGDLP